MDDKRIDTAAEPVEVQDDEFMDTGMLHPQPCTGAGCKIDHPHKESQ